MTSAKVCVYVIAITTLVLIVVEKCEASQWEKFPYSNVYFQFNKDKKTWDDAKKACERNGGFLAEPISCDLDTFLRLRVYALSGDWWIGGSDRGHEGRFTWAHSGKNFEYKNWAPDEPNNAGGNQHCAQYWQDVLWDDVSCKEKRPYICQK